MGMQQLQSQVGRTGLAGSGSGMQALDAGREQFLQQQQARDLQNRESAFGYNKEKRLLLEIYNQQDFN